MIIHTASEGISLVRKLETESAGYYEALALKYPQAGDTFRAFTKENRNNISQVERAYYGVITDALEGCFCFNLDTDNYFLDVTVPTQESYANLLAKAKIMEEKIIKFYSEAADQSKALMADVPRIFGILARKRQNRLTQLGSLVS